MAKIVCLRSRRLRRHANIFAKTKEFVLMQIVMLQTEYSLNIYLLSYSKEWTRKQL